MSKVVTIAIIQLLLLAVYECVNVKSHNIKLNYSSKKMYEGSDEIFSTSSTTKNIHPKNIIQNNSSQKSIIKDKDDLYEIIVETPKRDYFNNMHKKEYTQDKLTSENEIFLPQNQNKTSKLDSYQRDIIRRTIRDDNGKIKFQPKTMLNYGNVQYL